MTGETAIDKSASEQLSKTIITTERKESQDSLRLAEQISRLYKIPFARRKSFSVETLQEMHHAQFVLVVKKGLINLSTPEGEMFFHPNMAHLRVKNLRFGTNGLRRDNMVEAMGLESGMSVIDCTLGYGADAIVASFAVGETGSVTGIELSPLIYLVTSYGLSHFRAENYPIQEAMRRIKSVNVNSLEYLKRQPDNSVDVVYFDPMFRYPLKDSKNLNPLRMAADHSAVSEELVKEACRVAKCRVVMKENARSNEFARLGFDTIMGGKYSKVHYGVMML